MEVKDHPDAAYIKRDDIGLVIAKGLAVMYKTQPTNPCDFLAKWLLNYSEVEKQALAVHEHKSDVKDEKVKYESLMKTEEANRK